MYWFFGQKFPNDVTNLRSSFCYLENANKKVKHLWLTCLQLLRRQQWDLSFCDFQTLKRLDHKNTSAEKLRHHTFYLSNILNLFRGCSILQSWASDHWCQFGWCNCVLSKAANWKPSFYHITWSWQWTFPRSISGGRVQPSSRLSKSSQWREMARMEIWTGEEGPGKKSSCFEKTEGWTGEKGSGKEKNCSCESKDFIKWTKG